MANLKNYKRNFFTFLIFAEVRPLRTEVTDIQTETDKPIATGESGRFASNTIINQNPQLVRPPRATCKLMHLNRTPVS